MEILGRKLSNKMFSVKVRDKLICLKLGPARRALKSLLNIYKTHNFET